MSLTIELIPILQDNYCYLLTTDDGLCAVVDPGEAAPVLDVLERRGLTLDTIFNTHHHYDHTDGNAALIAATGAKLVGPKAEEARIAGMDIMLAEGETFAFGGYRFDVLDTPAHTRGHICFYCAQAKALFCGDTLFSLGCGRLFEGTADDLFAAFEKIRALPDDTLIYCGHEYTQANGRFCLQHDPDNAALRARMADVDALRAAGKPTLPVSLKMEKETNIFLRAPTPDALGHLRRLKDQS